MVNKSVVAAALGLLIASLSSSVLAGDSGMDKFSSCTASSVTTPCENKMWDIGVRALYLQSVYDANMSYVLDSDATVSLPNNNWGWGYRIEGSYHFNTGNDVDLNWSHYDKTNPFGQEYNGFDVYGPTLFKVTSTNKFDQVNLLLGQHVDISARKKVRFYGGLQYANIRVTQLFDHFQSQVTPLIGPNLVDETINTDFNGVGAVAGVDYSYLVTHGVSLVANGQAAMLYGTSRGSNSQAQQESTLFVPAGVVLSSTYASKKAIVPSLEAKLGLKAEREIAQGVLTLNAGYEAINYFNALVRAYSFKNSIANVTTPSNSDFGLIGPYFGVHWLGYV